MLTTAAKALAKNSVKAVAAHNRAWEERKLWQDRDAQDMARTKVPKLDPKRFFGREFSGEEPDEGPSTADPTSKKAKKRLAKAEKKRKKKERKKERKRRAEEAASSSSEDEAERRWLRKRRARKGAKDVPMGPALPPAVKEQERWGHDGFHEQHPDRPP